MMIRVLQIGDWNRLEMQAVQDALAPYAAGIDARHAPDADAVRRLVVDENWHADVAIVCQAWPDEFSEVDVQDMLTLLPLTRWIVCFGAWCESDGRNRTTWPLAFRVPARCPAARIAHEFNVVRHGDAALPLTASRNEIVQFDETATQATLLRRSTATPARPVTIVSPDPELASWLRDALRTVRYSVVAVDELPSDGVVVWDVDPWNASVAHELTEFCRAFPGASVVAIMSCSHPEDIAAIQQCGARAVVAKLTVATDLYDAVDGAMNDRTVTGQSV